MARLLQGVCFIALLALGSAADDASVLLQKEVEKASFAPQVEMDQELSAFERTVEKARASSKAFVQSKSGLQQIQLNSKTEFASLVVQAFPTASCVRRTQSLKKIPLHMKEKATVAPQVFGESPKGCGVAAPATSESAPAMCVFSHAFVNAVGDMCEASGCLTQNADAPLSASFVSCDDIGCSKGESESAVHDTVYSITQHNDGDLSSFMEHGVLRLLVGLDYLLGAGKSTPILVRQKTDEIMNVMKMFGISADRVITGNVKARALIYPEPVHAGTAPMTLTQLARWAVRKQLPLGLPTESRSRLPLVTVVKRSADSNAHLSNHESIVASLRKELTGYRVQEIDNMKDLPVTDAMRLFATSAVVVAPHGSGLYNLLGANPGGAVVEIMPSLGCESLVRPTVGMLLGLNYHLLYTDKAAWDGTMTVDEDVVVPVVRVALESVKAQTTA